MHRSQDKPSPKSSRQTFASAALLNPGLLHRHALSVDETAATYRYDGLIKTRIKVIVTLAKEKNVLPLKTVFKLLKNW